MGICRNQYVVASIDKLSLEQGFDPLFGATAWPVLFYQRPKAIVYDQRVERAVNGQCEEHGTGQ